ncbi:protein disulfide isomerase (PDI) protein [Borealophlyctis nickersoniae]|nr:protein disulfide isomerase (PDI) protein [Borealophlyctis nickersoniae]
MNIPQKNHTYTKQVPQYKKAAEKLKGLAKVVAIDCDDEKNRPVCGQYDIKGFPTIKLFSGGKKGLPEDYNGARTAKDIVDAAIKKIRGNVIPIGGTSKKAVTYDEFLKKETGKTPKVILVSQKPSTPPLFKALSAEYKGRLIFGEAKNTYRDAVEKLGVDSVPAVYLVGKEEDAKPVRYEGAMKYAALTEFLDKYAAPKGDGKAKSGQKAKESKPKKPAAPFNATLPELKTQSDLENLCLKTNSVCAVSFLALEPEYEESVKVHKQYLSILESLNAKYHEKQDDASPLVFSWVNAIERGRNLMRQFDVSDMLPGMVVFVNNANGSGRKVYRLFMGAFEEKALDKFLKETLGGGAGRAKYIPYDFVPTLDKEKKVKEKVEEKVEEVVKKVKETVEEKVNKAEEKVKDEL